MMKAQVLYHPAPVETQPLQWADVALPSIEADELLVKVNACGVCHTDLHVVERELSDSKLPIIPGHEIIATVAEVGAEASQFKPGMRVGIPWLHEACGLCEFCQRGHENLCANALFTGHTSNGGYAEYTTVRETFAVPIPDGIDDVHAAPLMCAGIVGYRSLRLADVQQGERIGLCGFGASAHICIQVARYWGCDVYVFTRSAEHQAHAKALGASWVGQASDKPPVPLDRAILFAPAGWLVPLVLEHLRAGGTLAINAIYASPIPEIPYSLLWGERTVRTVANATRQDAREFMQLAAQIPIVTDVETMPLAEANTALARLKRSEINGAVVLVP